MLRLWVRLPPTVRSCSPTSQRQRLEEACSTGSNPVRTTAKWRNGSRAGFKTRCLRTCGFDSHLGYDQVAKMAVAPDLSPGVLRTCGFDPHLGHRPSRHWLGQEPSGAISESRLSPMSPVIGCLCPCRATTFATTTPIAISVRSSVQMFGSWTLRTQLLVVICPDCVRRPAWFAPTMEV